MACVNEYGFVDRAVVEVNRVGAESIPLIGNGPVCVDEAGTTACHAERSAAPISLWRVVAVLTAGCAASDVHAPSSATDEADFAFLKVMAARHRLAGKTATAETRGGSLPEVRQFARQPRAEQDAQTRHLTARRRAWSMTPRHTRPS